MQGKRTGVGVPHSRRDPQRRRRFAPVKTPNDPRRLSTSAAHWRAYAAIDVPLVALSRPFQRLVGLIEYRLRVTLIRTVRKVRPTASNVRLVHFDGVGATARSWITERASESHGASSPFAVLSGDRYWHQRQRRPAEFRCVHNSYSTWSTEGPNLVFWFGISAGSRETCTRSRRPRSACWRGLLDLLTEMGN